MKMSVERNRQNQLAERPCSASWIDPIRVGYFAGSDMWQVFLKITDYSSVII